MSQDQLNNLIACIKDLSTEELLMATAMYMEALNLSVDPVVTESLINLTTLLGMENASTTKKIMEQRGNELDLFVTEEILREVRDKIRHSARHGKNHIVYELRQDINNITEHAFMQVLQRLGYHLELGFDGLHIYW